MENNNLNDNQEIMDDVKKAEAAAQQATEPQKPKKKGVFSSKKFKKGGMAIALTCIVIAAVVIINIIMSILVEKVPQLNIDLTASQKYELTQNSIDFLETVDKDIEIILLSEEKDYMAAGDYYIQVVKLVKQYANYNDHISVKFVNLVSEPAFQNNYPDETLYSASIIVQCGKNYKVLDPQSDIFEYTTDQTTYQQSVSGVKVEPSITSAILNVTTDEKTKVAFINGLGETDASYFKSVLKNNNYDVSDVTIQTGDIESDASVAILFTPSVDMDDNAVKKISDFLENNGEYGKTLLYVPTYQQTETPVLDSFLEEWGIAVEKGILAETDANSMIMQNNYFYSIANYANTDLTAGLKNPSVPLLMGYSRPISILNTDKVTPLLTSSDKGALYPFDADEDYNPDNETKETKNLAVMSTYTGESKNSYVIVDGSYFSFTEQAMSGTTYNNSAYYVNLINTQSGHEDQTIAIDSKTTADTSLGIVSAQISFLGALFMFIIPLGILIAGIVIWLRRRNR